MAFWNKNVFKNIICNKKGVCVLIVLVTLVIALNTFSSPTYYREVSLKERRFSVVEADSGAVILRDDSAMFDTERMKKQYDLRIIVIVYNRAKSLFRLLESLNQALYSNDSIKLEVWIDRSKDGSVDEDVNRVTSSYVFEHGDYSVHRQQTHVGLYGQWLNPWTPIENSPEIAVILEDDVEVSPWFYKYLKLVHQKYDHIPDINGYALQGISIKHSGAPGLLQVNGTHVFMYPVLGSWGFSPSTKNWINFLRWFRTAFPDPLVRPYVPDNVATGWYRSAEKNGRGCTIWTIWHIYFAWLKKEYTLYCNFKDHQGLTANWMEKGLHYSQSHKERSNPLLTAWKEEYDHLPYSPVKLNTNGDLVENQTI